VDNDPVLDDERFLARARGGEWLPSDHPAASSAADAAESLGYYEELLHFITWLVGEAGSLAVELSDEARAMIKLDLVPLEREAEHRAEHCEFWRRRVTELEGDSYRVRDAE
jgi:hypothetical protein